MSVHVLIAIKISVNTKYYSSCHIAKIIINYYTISPCLTYLLLCTLSSPYLSIGRQPHYQSICKAGQKLRTEGQLASKAIGHRVSQLQDKWKKLNDSATARKTRLEEAAKSQQV